MKCGEENVCEFDVEKDLKIVSDFSPWYNIRTVIEINSSKMTKAS
ncbi:hypothetical protein [Sulfurimonas sp. HSL3-7]